MSLRILHFSDLHLVKDEPSMKTLLMHFIQSMDEIQKDGNIDLVVFTGDLVDKGGCSFWAFQPQLSDNCQTQTANCPQ